MRPGKRVRVAYLGESPLAAESSLGPRRRLGRRDVTAGDQCDDLLHRQRLTCRQVGEDLVADLELLVDESIRRRRGRRRRAIPWSARRGRPGICDCVVSTVSSTEFGDSSRLVRDVRWVLASSR